MVRTLLSRKYYLYREPKIYRRMSNYIHKAISTRANFLSIQIIKLKANTARSKVQSECLCTYSKKEFNFSKNNSNRGQVLILSILLLPIFAVLLSGLGSSIKLLTTQMKQQKICRKFTYLAQKEIVKGFIQLKALNPKAKQLRKRLERALLVLAMNPYNPKSIADVAYIKTKQILLGRKQQAIIMMARTKAKSILTQIPGARTTKLPPFKLIAKPAFSLSPSYVNPTHLKYKQDIKIQWKINSPSMEGQCGSHVKALGTNYKIKYSYPDTR